MITFSPEQYGNFMLSHDEIGVLVQVAIGLFIVISWTLVFLSLRKMDKRLKQLTELLNERLPEQGVKAVEKDVE
jgi:hypothetical protein